MTQIKKKKEREAISGKKGLFGKTFFTSVLTIAREMPKTKGKNPDKMCDKMRQNLYFRISKK